MRHQDSFGSRTMFLLMQTKQSSTWDVSSSGFMTYVSVKSHPVMATIWCLLCGESFWHKTATRETKSVIILCQRPAPECTCPNMLIHPP
jgi:hypothetical protein